MGSGWMRKRKLEVSAIHYLYMMSGMADLKPKTLLVSLRKLEQSQSHATKREVSMVMF